MRYYRPHNEVIRKIAKLIAGQNKVTGEQIQAVQDYIHADMEYITDLDNPYCERIDCKKDIITAYVEGVADCEELAGLTASVLKSMGVKNNIVVGDLYQNGEWSGHVWVEAFDKEDNFYIIETTRGAVFKNQDYDELSFYKPMWRVKR